MKILMISHEFWPDSTSVSQHMTDLAVELSNRNNSVAIMASRYAYENPAISFKPREYFHTIFITRLWQTRFGKERIWGRLINIFTYMLSLSYQLIKIARRDYDAIIGTTSPPLGSLPVVFISKIIKIPFCFWAMDLQPELSIAAGYLKENSLAAKITQKSGMYIYNNSDLIITLDKYMADYIGKKCGKKRNITTIPVWPVVGVPYNGKRMDNPFRKKNNFGNKCIIMYSGNHAVVHPLMTLLETAKSLRDDNRFIFVFIGGGVRITDVIKFKKENSLDNIIILPYQDREMIHLSLGSADIHVVIHGNGCTGFTHPSKIYGAMFIGKPVLYIGPSPSHITDIIENINGNMSVRHGDTGLLIKELNKFFQKGEKEWNKIGKKNMEYAEKYFSPGVIINKYINSIENVRNKPPESGRQA